ncbi:DUF982 domain-containing protein [Ensifer sp. ENS07]|nr:DUF982 domain-containing protein [Ensifer sp. ENS07]
MIPINPFRTGAHGKKLIRKEQYGSIPSTTGRRRIGDKKGPDPRPSWLDETGNTFLFFQFEDVREGERHGRGSVGTRGTLRTRSREGKTNGALERKRRDQPAIADHEMLVGSASEASTVLRDNWSGSRSGPAYQAALSTCLEAMNGHLPGYMARLAFEEAAREAGVLR